jgi:transcriptional regulator with XRE-family HTH domain
MNNNLDKFKALVSDEKSGWLTKAKWREENQDWLDISFAIAVKILAAFRANKKTGTFPKSQKELAEAMGCSPQYVNKLLKGTENLQLETITKIGDILNIKLIEVPQFETTIQVDPLQYVPYKKSEVLVNIEERTSNYTELLSSFLYNNEPESKLKLVA